MLTHLGTQARNCAGKSVSGAPSAGNLASGATGVSHRPSVAPVPIIGAAGVIAVLAKRPAPRPNRREYAISKTMAGTALRRSGAP